MRCACLCSPSVQDEHISDFGIYVPPNQTRGDAGSTMSEISQKYTEIVCFSLVLPHFRFIEDKDGYKQKVLIRHRKVRLLVELDCGNTF